MLTEEMVDLQRVNTTKPDYFDANACYNTFVHAALMLCSRLTVPGWHYVCSLHYSIYQCPFGDGKECVFQHIQ